VKLPFIGKNKQVKRKPTEEQIATRTVHDKYSTYPSNGLTPQRLATILKEADTGDISRQMELFEEMEEKDLHLFSQLQTRKNAVTGLDFEIIAFSDDDRDKKIADFVEEQLKAIDSIEDIFTDLLDAIGKGIAVSEIMWAFRDGHHVVDEINWVHQKKFLFDDDDNFKIVTDEEPMGRLLPENKFIIHKYKAKSGHPSRAGILRIAAWMYLFKNYSMKDWVAFCEVYGMPLRLGKYDPNASEDEKNKLMEALIRIGTDAAGIVPDNSTIEFIESAKGTTSEIYKLLSEFCNSEISKAILGQTLTSDTGGGSLAQGKVHNEVRHDLTVADCKALASTLKRYLIKPLVLFNFGETRRLPSIVFDCKEEEDLNTQADIYDKFINKLGMPVSKNHLYKKFGIPVPDDDEDVVTSPVLQQSQMALKNNMIMMAHKTSSGENEMAAITKHNASYQKKVDDLTDVSLDLSEDIFDKMIKPIMELVNKVDSLEEINEILQSEEAVEKLLGDMHVEDFEDLLQKVMVYGDALGRMKENERVV
jgi:phage gp29-like protein